ncbi:molybdopterin cofactor-binding domain-containing protein [Ensifer aridi]|uniref:molybdopterin cofactor-binding domain-containing protein n=1 Tax=Ensifer aridi TaxID=1708715 RepID=UPI001FCD9DC2|nr:molybdopterin cofactor-binding domain-containing protein [Ensifer aridi]
MTSTFSAGRPNIAAISACSFTLRTWPHVTLAALAARHVGRPVKLVLTRKQMFFTTGHRPRTRQRVALGATPEGRLTGIIHEGMGETSRYEQFMEALTNVTDYLYSCPNVRTQYHLTQLDTGTPNHMRGPGEASGIFARDIGSCSRGSAGHRSRPRRLRAASIGLWFSRAIS